MKLHSVLLASACVFALAAPASAQVSGNAALGYAHTQIPGDSINQGILNGSFATPLSDSGINLEGDAGFDRLSDSVGANTVWNLGATGFWSNDTFRAGATVNYTDVKFGSDSGSINFVNYGAFGEFFLDSFTLGAKGGGFSGSDSLNGTYVGGEAVGYAMPDLAFSGTVDYTKLNLSTVDFNETDFTVQGEWLFSEETPLSIYGGYTHTSFTGAQSGDGNTVFVGIRFYFNPTGTASLEQRQRTGSVGWGAAFQPLGASL